MIFNESVPVDESGLLLICPKCGNQEFSQNTQECSICGTSRRNLCMPDQKKIMPHVNAINARYCEACGAETVFYHYGVLKPWQDVLDIIKKEARRVVIDPRELPF